MNLKFVPRILIHFIINTLKGLKYLAPINGIKRYMGMALSISPFLPFPHLCHFQGVCAFSDKPVSACCLIGWSVLTHPQTNNKSDWKYWWTHYGTSQAWLNFGMPCYISTVASDRSSRFHALKMNCYGWNDYETPRVLQTSIYALLHSRRIMVPDLSNSSQDFAAKPLFRFSLN